jgi:uncharacterized repeat protein (TIGR03803 family)
MKTTALTGNLARLLLIAALGICIPGSALASPVYKVLYSFNGTDGTGPLGGVTPDGKGNLFGASASGGNLNECNGYGCGLVFKLLPHANGKWSERILYSFEGGDDGAGPYGKLIQDASGTLYGTTTGGGNGTYHDDTVFQLTPGAGGWNETILFDFDFYDGAVPYAGVIMDAAGNLYGTTASSADGGIVFQLSPGSGGWQESILYTAAGTDAGVILDGSGNLYGTTEEGGAYNDGTVYEIERTATGWKEKVLHSFDPNGKDGVTPGGGALFMDGAGSLYGTTVGGGTSECGGAAHRRPARQPPSKAIGNCGTVFRLTKGGDGGWTETILYDFKGGASGYFPGAGVVMDKAGNLYGTAALGGEPFCDCGVIYKLAPGPKGKWTYTVLHEFGNGDDGGVPAGNLVMDGKGNLYGGTVLGGTYGGGVIFELTP